MFVSIFILILFLPTIFLPLGLSTFFSADELDEMGIRLEMSDDTSPMQGHDLVDIFPISNGCEQLQTC